MIESDSFIEPTENDTHNLIKTANVYQTFFYINGITFD